MNCSMNFKVIPTPTFAKSLKALAKRHRSMKADMDAFRKSLEEDPFQGTELTPGVRKIRMAITSKGGGKSGGARVITYNVLTTEQDGKVYLMEIYDKSDAQTVKLNVIKEWIKEL
jgi:mRNA-degrading endonuclease RelE of RelBE toxin-antitoxin system